MRTWLWSVFRYLHLTLGMADALGIQNPKQNNEATVWRPGSEGQPSGPSPPPALPRSRGARDIVPPHASTQHAQAPVWAPFTLSPAARKSSDSRTSGGTQAGCEPCVHGTRGGPCLTVLAALVAWARQGRREAARGLLGPPLSGRREKPPGDSRTPSGPHTGVSGRNQGLEGAHPRCLATSAAGPERPTAGVHVPSVAAACAAGGSPQSAPQSLPPSQRFSPTVLPPDSRLATRPKGF